VVFTEAQTGRDAEFNEWYDKQHVPDVLKVPGYCAAQRFRLEPDPNAPAGGPNKYLALYEMETDDVAATLAELMKRAGTSAMPMSEAMGQAIVTHLATPITSRVAALLANA
jgi:hypothetical protein